MTDLRIPAEFNTRVTTKAYREGHAEGLANSAATNPYEDIAFRRTFMARTVRAWLVGYRDGRRAYLAAA